MQSRRELLRSRPGSEVEQGFPGGGGARQALALRVRETPSSDSEETGGGW